MLDIIKNIVHGLYGNLNPNTREYNKDDYWLTSSHRTVTVVKVPQLNIEIDNCWIIPYWLIMSNTLKH